MSLFSLSTWSIFWAGWVKGIILGTWLIDKFLLEHVGLTHVLDLAVHLVNFFGLMSQGGHSEQVLLLALFYQSTPSCLKVGGGVVGGGGGPCDYCVSPVQRIVFLGFLDFVRIWGPVGTGDWGLGLTLDNCHFFF